jgi:hypothetical protein
MRTRTFRIAALSTAAAATALIAGTTLSATNAEARRGHHHHHHHHGHAKFGLLIGAPVAYYGAGYAYGGGCGWLYRRAVATGSPYWWNRFHICRGY